MSTDVGRFDSRALRIGRPVDKNTALECLDQHALWLAAGIIFARLMASRLSLLIARIDYLMSAFYATPFWQWWTGR